MVIYNVFLYVVCGLVMQNWILPLYSVVTHGAALKTVDFIVQMIDPAAFVSTSDVVDVFGFSHKGR